MAVNGIAVISEMNYLSNDIPEIVTQYMKNAYPGIKTESKNMDLINSSGFNVLGVHQLPSNAWWENYYGPLCENIRALKGSRDDIMRAVISETEEESAAHRYGSWSSCHLWSWDTCPQAGKDRV